MIKYALVAFHNAFHAWDGLINVHFIGAFVKFKRKCKYALFPWWYAFLRNIFVDFLFKVVFLKQYSRDNLSKNANSSTLLLSDCYVVDQHEKLNQPSPSLTLSPLERPRNSNSASGFCFPRGTPLLTQYIYKVTV